METISMSEIERKHTGHWFDADSKRFFRSRVGETAYRGPGGTFFVSSEQFVNGGYRAPRLYTIREQSESGDISTIGPFNKMSRATAHRFAKMLAEDRDKGLAAIGPNESWGA